MTQMIVIYDPDISNETKKLIKKELEPAMISQDGDSAQYNIEDILIIITNKNDIEKIKSYNNADYLEF